MVDIMAGAEPWSFEGGPTGVLVLHGFTGNPSSMRGLAESLAEAGHSIEMPLLPGHGTTIEDMLQTNWVDWSSAAEAALQRLKDRTEHQVVAGLSMGGSLTLWLGTRHPDLSGLITINAAAVAAAEVRELVQSLIDSGEESMAGISSDIADPDVVESAYELTPLKPLMSLLEAASEVGPDLAKITQPILVLTSPQDHVVPPSDSDFIAESVSGPVERVFLERSYHVATQDYDKQVIFERSAAFVEAVTSGD